MNFEPDPDEGTLPPGEVSRQATERMLELTGTAPERGGLEKQDRIRQRAFLEISESDKPRTKWTHTEIRKLATPDQWDYAERTGHLDVGTVCAVGNLLLKGMSPTAARKALGITPLTWNTWYAKGMGDGTHTQGTHTQHSEDTRTSHDDTQHVGVLPQAPYNVFSFIVDHSQAVLELKAVTGWTGHFDRDWRSAQAYLVARNPDEWNPVSKSTIDTTSKVDSTVVVQQDTQGLYEVAAILARAGALPKAVATVEVLQVESVEVSDSEISDRSESHTDDR